MCSFDGYHPVPAHFALMARHLVADLDRAFDITAPSKRGDGGQQPGVVIGNVGSDEAFRVFFGKKRSREDAGNKTGVLHLSLIHI